MSSEAFAQAVQHVKTGTKQIRITNDDRLRFYSFFKQATTGDCMGSAPSRFSVVEHAKYSAWVKLKGVTPAKAKQMYVDAVCSMDPDFKPAEAEAPSETATATATSTATASSNSGTVAVTDAAMVSKPSVDKGKAASGPSQFVMSVLLCLCASGVGVVGFLLTVLNNQALVCLALAVGGLLGVVGCFASLLDANGLIKLYSPILQGILLERTMVEVLLDGTVVKRIKAFIAEIYPILYCQTEEDRLQVLANMSESTRRLMTLRGVVNLLPEWQQRVTLSGKEYARQRAQRSQDRIAFRPALDAQPHGTRRRNPPTPRVEQQAHLASRFMSRAMRDRLALALVRGVNPQVCKGAAIAFALSLFVQLRLSRAARNGFKRFLKSSLLSGSSFGAVLCLLFAVAHNVSKRYVARRNIAPPAIVVAPSPPTIAPLR